MSTRRTRKRTSANVIAYIRVSTEDQNLGPDAQRAAIEEWASRNGKQVVEFFVDHGISGAAPIEKRPALGSALHALRTTRASALVVAKLDRLARDVELASFLDKAVQKLGAQIVSADGVGAGDGAESALIRGIMHQFAAYERALIRSRTSAALQAKRRKGERVGQVPYGFRDEGGRLVPEPHEQVVISQIQALAAQGLSQRKIAEHLNSRGVPARPQNRRGVPQGVGVPGRWHQPAVCLILQRERALEVDSAEQAA